MSNRRFAILLAVSILSAASVRAQEPASALPERLTLPVLLRLVAERSPRVAVEQGAIELPFQFQQRAAHRGLGHAQAFGARGDVFAPGHGGEDLQLAQGELHIQTIDN